MTTISAGVWLVSDDEKIRSEVSFVLTEGGVSCSKFASSKHALEMICLARPTCLIVDQELEGMDGLELMSRFNSQFGKLPFILMTRQGSVDLAVCAMRMGAVTVLELPIHHQKLVNAAREGLKLDAERRKHEDQCLQFNSRLQSLTAREREIAELVFEGKLSKQIAKLLSISPKTVEVHRSRITKKLEVESVTQLVKLMQLTRR
jgi:RNA polymerase sigma factor (sigma-70 family)